MTMYSDFSSLVIKVCQNPEKYPGNRLQSAASISLSKMMMTSSEFCNSYIQVSNLLTYLYLLLQLQIADYCTIIELFYSYLLRCWKRLNNQR